MILENSGNIYIIPLEHNLGYTVGMFLDFSDISSFDGRLMYVYNLVVKKIPSDIKSFQISGLDIIFGPMTINLPPNVRGKNAWKLVGKEKNISKLIPKFKSTQYATILNKALDWSTVPEWYIVSDFTKKSEYRPYEQIRKLETLYLYDKRDISIRATMHFLIKMGKDVNKYYDLSIGRYREIYLLHLNTVFNKETAEKLYKGLHR